MSETDWRELLDDEEVRSIVTRVVNGPGRRMYNPTGQYALLFDDLESFLWDRAVDIAIAFEFNEIDPDGDPRDQWHRVLYASLATAAGFLYGAWTGGAGSARRDAWARGIDSVERITDLNATEGHRGLEARLDQSDPFWWHRLTGSDPLGVLLRRERLLSVLRAAETRALSGAYVTETSPDVLCRDPLCRNLVVRAGWCEHHYKHQFKRWGRLDGTSDECEHPGCRLIAVTRGYCHTHYNQEYKRRRATGDMWVDPEPGPCRVEGCERIEKAKGLCGMHYQQEREASTAPCAEPGCLRNAFCKGLCRLHYRRQYERRAPDGTNICQVPGCNLLIRSKGLCENHYRAQLRRR